MYLLERCRSSIKTWKVRGEKKEKRKKCKYVPAAQELM